jgi:hypothetical protein
MFLPFTALEVQPLTLTLSDKIKRLVHKPAPGVKQDQADAGMPALRADIAVVTN